MRILLIGHGFLSSQISYMLTKKKIENIILTTNKKKISEKISYFDFKNKNLLSKLIKKNDCVIYTSGPDQDDCNKKFRRNVLFIENEFNNFLKIC